MASFGDHVTYQLEREIARGENGLGSRKHISVFIQWKLHVQLSFTTKSPDVCLFTEETNKLSYCKVSNKNFFLHHLISMTS